MKKLRRESISEQVFQLLKEKNYQRGLGTRKQDSFRKPVM